MPRGASVNTRAGAETPPILPSPARTADMSSVRPSPSSGTRDANSGLAVPTARHGALRQTASVRRGTDSASLVTALGCRRRMCSPATRGIETGRVMGSVMSSSTRSSAHRSRAVALSRYTRTSRCGLRGCPKRGTDAPSLLSDSSVEVDVEAMVASGSGTWRRRRGRTEHHRTTALKPHPFPW
jgi:hypothetical protein